MELKVEKNVLCLIVVVLLDLRVRVRRGEGCSVIYELVTFFKEEEDQCGWCVVSIFASVCLSVCLSAPPSQLKFWLADRCLPSFDLFPLSRNLFLISLGILGFLCFFFFCFFLLRRSHIDRKITFNYFYFLTNFIDISLCADAMRRNHFSPFWRKFQHR